MVVLTEDARALDRVGDSIVLEGLFALQLHGREDNTPASAAHNAVEFAQGLMVVLDVLHNMVADDGVERLRLKGYLLNIEVHIGQRALQVGRYVAVGRGGVHLLKLTHKGHLGGYVQHLGQSHSATTYIALAHEPQPQQAVTLQREAVGAEGILARGDVAIRQKLTALASAQRALLALTEVEQAHHGDNPPGHALQHGARNEIEYEFYKVFHSIRLTPILQPSPLR